MSRIDLELDHDNYSAIVVANGSTDDSHAKMIQYCTGRMNETGELAHGSEERHGHVHLLDLDQERALAATPDEILGELKSHPRTLILIRNESNLGFAKACNIGMIFALNALDSDYVMLLNNDTVVDQALLRELVEPAEKDDRIGLIDPRTYYYSHQGREDVKLYAGGRIIPWREIVYKHIGTGEFDTGQFDEDGETEWCTGGGMMIRAGLARDRLLNSKYHFGNEGAEYSMRARKDGWRGVYVHKAEMWHKVGVSRVKIGATLRRGIRSYFRFIWSNFSLPWYLCHVFLFMTVVLQKWFFV